MDENKTQLATIPEEIVKMKDNDEGKETISKSIVTPVAEKEVSQALDLEVNKESKNEQDTIELPDPQSELEEMKGLPPKKKRKKFNSSAKHKASGTANLVKARAAKLAKKKRHMAMLAALQKEPSDTESSDSDEERVFVKDYRRKNNRYKTVYTKAEKRAERLSEEVALLKTMMTEFLTAKTGRKLIPAYPNQIPDSYKDKNKSNRVYL